MAIRTFPMVRFVVAALIAAVLLLSTCSGGFLDDSPNAPEIETSIFGGDSL